MILEELVKLQRELHARAATIPIKFKMSQATYRDLIALIPNVPNEVFRIEGIPIEFDNSIERGKIEPIYKGRLNDGTDRQD